MKDGEKIITEHQLYKEIGELSTKLIPFLTKIQDDGTLTETNLRVAEDIFDKVRGMIMAFEDRELETDPEAKVSVQAWNYLHGVYNFFRSLFPNREQRENWIDRSVFRGKEPVTPKNLCGKATKIEFTSQKNLLYGARS